MSSSQLELETYRSSKSFLLCFIAIIMTFLITSCGSKSECLCVRSHLTYAITMNSVSSVSQQKIRECEEFISNSGSLSFYTSQVYSILKNTELQKKFLLLAIEKGIDVQTIFNYEFVKPLTEDPDFLVLMQSASASYINNTLDHDLREKIDALYILHQEVRTEGRTIIDTEVVTDEAEVDAHILNQLDDAVKDRGFNELSLSVTGTYKLWTILLHSLTHVSESQFRKYENVLKSAICDGHLNPQYLSSIIDRRRRFKEQQDPLYYEYNLEQAIPADIPKVSGLRYNMGLEPLFRNVELIDSIFRQPCTSCR